MCDPLNSITWNTRAWVARAAGNAGRVQSIYAQLRGYEPGLPQAAQEYLAQAMLGHKDALQGRPAALADPAGSTYGIALQVARLRGMDRAQAHAWIGTPRREGNKIQQWQLIELVNAALFGDRAEANRLAARLDARPAGGLLLSIAVTYCGCGAPFNLSATPNFKAQLDESGLRWPPPVAIRYPPLPGTAP